MKRIIPTIVIVIALLVTVVGLFRPWMGETVDTWETSNQSFRIRVEQHSERTMALAGAYYVFLAAPSSSNDWREVMSFRHDDPVAIPQKQVRFVNDRIGYLFMGWMYAVTTDSGTSWSVWSAKKDLSGWQCCNYGLIKQIRLEPDGKGVMILNPIPQRRGEVPELHTEDYGQHWHL